ncbi:MAG: regulatory protein [Cyclobacteriaceae bacterium]|jgi:regulatory protein
MDDDRLNKGFGSAAKYCALRERAPKQVIEKLLLWDFTQEQAEKILSRLIAENFLNEERFARSFCHDKFEFNNWGKIKINMELDRFDLDHQIMEEALEAIDPKKYRDKVAALAKAKWQLIKDKGDDFVQKGKTATYLMNKGFEGDLVWKVVKEL